MLNRIIHIDDDDAIWESVRPIVHPREYIARPTLADLEDLLKTPVADLYLLDGTFFRAREPSPKEYLVPEAIDLIRARYPRARIVILSNDPERCCETAEEKNVRFMNKSEGVVACVRELLNEYT